MGRPLLPAVLALALMCLIPGGVLLRGDQPLIQVDDAYVEAIDGGGWAIGNTLVRYTLRRQGLTVGVRSITDVGTGRDWSRSKGPDGFITINDQRISIGSSATTFTDARRCRSGGAACGSTCTIGSPRMRSTSRGPTPCYPASSVVEVWTTYQAGNRQLTLADLNDYAFSVENGTMKWVTGLGTTDDAGGPFTVKTSDLDDGQVFEIGADDRASESTVPWYSILTPDQQFFGAVLWSGSWRVRATRHGDTIDLQAGMPSFKTTLGVRATLETPHAIFGMTTATTPEVSMALKGYIDQGAASRPAVLRVRLVQHVVLLRHGHRRSLAHWRKWISRPPLGAEQFVVDAGWWPGIDGDDASDFVHGLGHLAKSTWIGSRTAWARCPITRTSSACDSACGSSPSGRSRDDQPAGRRRRTVPGDASTGGTTRASRTRRPSRRRSALPMPEARTWVHRPARRAHRRGAPRLPEVGQQLLDQLQSRRPRPRRGDGNFAAHARRATWCAMTLRDALPGHGNRGLLERRQSPVARHARVQRRDLARRSHVALRSRPPQSRRASSTSFRRRTC